MGKRRDGAGGAKSEQALQHSRAAAAAAPTAAVVNEALGGRFSSHSASSKSSGRICVVRLKVRGRRVEVACWRERLGEGRDPIAAVARPALYANFSKGEKLSEKDVAELFGPGCDLLSVAARVVCDGRVVEGERERREQRAKQDGGLLAAASAVAAASHHPFTGERYTQQEIADALRDEGWQPAPTETAAGQQRQAAEALQLLCATQKVPLERDGAVLRVSGLTADGLTGLADLCDENPGAVMVVSQDAAGDAFTAVVVVEPGLAEGVRERVGEGAVAALPVLESRPHLKRFGSHSASAPAGIELSVPGGRLRHRRLEQALAQLSLGSERPAAAGRPRPAEAGDTVQRSDGAPFRYYGWALKQGESARVVRVWRSADRRNGQLKLAVGSGAESEWVSADGWSFADGAQCIPPPLPAAAPKHADPSEALSKLTNKELMERCREKGLSTKGRRQDFIDRLEEL
eukprot:TRINITY_DN36189_c0_g1_i1.p1 TRINITY_DN36189_c0_g1~~TRINITY_DN36189_c0_g1_i1.p1  ORF type:complete len:461 (+),score=168.66 TRINITY_DN36189_c0_g1_i1:82-1464(+)